ncbi:hypothetical protein ACF09H_11145 [Streptomyces sp. NPDC014983]|uniref:hypothetical protein n=1 Tax=Streptomyces sp. NPDC014983 TaxID=3364933 RepID=UPI0036FF5F88
MRSKIVRVLVASVAAGTLAGGAAMASTGTAVAVPANTHATAAQHASTPRPTPSHKKCPKGEHFTKANGKWGCHKM